MSGWPPARQRHGGADRIPLPDEQRGQLWLCGKHFIGPDVDDALRQTGATAVVCLNEPHELEDRYPGYVRWLRTDDRAIWHPVADLHAPTAEAATALVAEVRRQLDDGQTVLVHCGAGIGRAGTLAAAVLLDLGLGLQEALDHVAAHRPMAGPEAGAQRELLDRLAADRRLPPR